MEDTVHELAHALSAGVEILAIILITAGVLLAVLRAICALLRRRQSMEIYNHARIGVGRTLILGLDFLLAAEIMHSIQVDESINSVLILGLIVVIRTFLSITIEMEITGHWPWQDRNAPAKSTLDKV